MFPLGLVVLPGAVVPLHVFEPRYRALVVSLLALDGPMEFGIPPIVRGSEVGGGDVRGDIATIVKVLDLRVHDDGRYDMVVAGTRRVEVVTWLPDDPFPLAEVDAYDDIGDVASASDTDIAERRERIESLLARMRRLGDRVPDGVPELDADPVLRLFQLGVVAPIGDLDRMRMLAVRSPVDRIGVLDRALDDVEAVLEFRES
jgi:Lon protease-like protein